MSSHLIGLLGMLSTVAFGSPLEEAKGSVPPNPQDTLRFTLRERPAYRDTLRFDQFQVVPDGLGGFFMLSSSLRILRRIDSTGTVTAQMSQQQLGEGSRVYGLAWARDTLLLGFGGNPGSETRLLMLNGKLQVLGEAYPPTATTGTQFTGIWPALTGWLTAITTYRKDGKSLERTTTQVQHFNTRNPGAASPVAELTEPDARPSVRNIQLPQMDPARLRLLPWPSRGGLVVAPDRSYHLQFMEENGKVVTEKTHQVPGLPVPRRLRDSILAMLSPRSDTAFLPEARKFITSTPLPNRKVIGGLWVAPDGRMAVLRSDLALSLDTELPIDILNPEGQFIGRLTLPGTHRILAFLGEALLTSWVDTSSATLEKLAQNKNYPAPLRLSRWTLLSPSR